LHGRGKQRLRGEDACAKVGEKTAAGQHAGREARLLEARGQAPDHPILLAAEETGYLKAYYLQVK